MANDELDDRARQRSGSYQGSMWARMDRAVERLAERFHGVAVGLFLTGLLLAVGSFLIGVFGVEFDGELKYGLRITAPEGQTLVPKQVGFGFAPNWFLTGAFLLPYAIMQLLKARLAVEPLIETLIDRQMLVTTSFERPDSGAVIDAWREKSRQMMPVVFFVVVVVFGLAVYDFVSVVAQWTLADEAQLIALVGDGVTLHHKDYEFDWSVAAIFASTDINPLVNVVFAGAAYLAIAALGACFLFAGFIYFFVFGNFFSHQNLCKQELQLVPNPKSEDSRCGFEVFEEFFDSFIQAAVVAAVIALGMYLQNIYLRAPEQGHIASMVLGPVQSIIEDLMNNASELKLGDLLGSGMLQNVYELSGYEFGGVPLQVFGSAVALLLIVVIVFGYVWWFLRASALQGAATLSARGAGMVSGSHYTAEDLKKLSEISVWPLSWISVNLLLACIVVIIACVWWPRLVALFLALAIYRAIVTVYKALAG